MLHQGNQDERILQEISGEIAKIRFANQQDQHILTQWFADFQKLTLQLSSDAYEVEKRQLPIGTIPAYNFEKIKDFSSVLTALKEIQESLARGDESTARSQLYRLTQMHPKSKLALVLIILGFLALGLGVIFYNRPTAPAETELERLQNQFKQD